MDRNQENTLLEKSVDHSQFVNRIVKELCDISYYLNKLPALPVEFRNSETSEEYFQKSYRNKIIKSLEHLKQEDPKGYIDSHGNLFTLFNHLEKRVESEVLNNIKSSKS